MVLSTLVRQGKLTRVCRGLYALPDRPASEHATLARAEKRDFTLVLTRYALERLRPRCL